MKHIPAWFFGTQFRRQTKEHLDAMLDKPYQAFRHAPVNSCHTLFKQLVSNVITSAQMNSKCSNSVAALLLEMIRQIIQDPSYTEEIVKSTLESMYGGGADTVTCFWVSGFKSVYLTFIPQTISAVASFSFAMVLYLELQKKARAEIDHVLRTSNSLISLTSCCSHISKLFIRKNLLF